MNTISRRNFLQISGTAAATLVFQPAWAKLAGSASLSSGSDPHFFLQFFMNGGADNTYLFDGRPLSMTAAGKIQNYIGTEPSPWVGRNGNQCLATELTKPLLPYKDYFSVLNGVLMETSFDGHDQNVNTFFTGNPFGGESFLPHLNLDSPKLKPVPLDVLDNGRVRVTASNGSSTVAVGAQSAQAVVSKLNTTAVLDSSTELGSFIRSRIEKNSNGNGRFQLASKQLLQGFDQAPSLHEKLKTLPTLSANASDDMLFAEMVCNFFRNDIARSCVWTFDERFDVHAASQAQTQPQMFRNVIGTVAKVIEYLKNTPFDRTRSMLDVTTFLVTSEFGRTMRQQGVPIDQTGTNHNPLSNTFLVGGKGIKCGQVIGSSDFASETETLSAAHIGMDRGLEKIMGRPFDFATQRSRIDLPPSLELTDYLTVHSVINTIYQLFEIPPAKNRTIGRLKLPALPVTSLLV